eukprot:287820_1
MNSSEHILISKLQAISTLRTRYSSIKCPICQVYQKREQYGEHLMQKCGHNIDVNSIHKQMTKNQCYDEIYYFMIGYHHSKRGVCPRCRNTPSDFGQHLKQCITSQFQLNIKTDDSCVYSTYPRNIYATEFIALAIALTNYATDTKKLESALTLYYCFGFTLERVDAICKYESDQINNNNIEKCINGFKRIISRPLEVIKDPMIKKNPQEKYTIKKSIGQGTFGQVYLCRTKDGRNVAIKRINQKKISNRYIYGETMALSSMEHENVLMLIDSCYLWNNHVFFVCELAQTDGSKFLHELRMCTGNSRNPGYVMICKWGLLQIAAGMNYIHERKMIHRDLKLENILIYGGGVWKIGDFGLVIDVLIRPATSNVGVTEFIAPEQLLGLEYNEKSDIYAFAFILLFVMYTQLFMNAKPEQLKVPNIIKVLNKNNLWFPMCLLDNNPKKRPTAKDLPKYIHEWEKYLQVSMVRPEFCLTYANDMIIQSMNVKKELKNRNFFGNLINSKISKTDEMEVAYAVKNSMELSNEVRRYSQTFLKKKKAKQALGLKKVSSKLKQTWDNITLKLYK